MNELLRIAGLFGAGVLLAVIFFVFLDRTMRSKDQESNDR